MALANSSGMIFDSWSPQMILSAIDNGPSPEPLSSASSLAGAVATSGGWLCGSSSASLLNFAGGTGDDNFEAWIDALDSNNNCSTAGRLQVEMMKKTGTAGAKCLLDDQTSAETADGCTSSPAKSKLRQKNPILQDCDSPSPKKRCGITRTAKDKQSPSKDPQSIAAKNRRERISERLRILQDLVPNGTKVDLVTMLEKAINYVKFLQLQVKVLATDEFWPAQGGIAPDVAQVKKAIDAILSPGRDGNF